MENTAEIRQKIDAYFAEKLKPVLHVDTIVFDLAFVNGEEILLIEINPYGSSDPCWFGDYASVESATGAVQVDYPEQTETQQS